MNVEALSVAVDTFTTIGDFMRFTRDAAGVVDGLTLAASGARGVRFERAGR